MIKSKYYGDSLSNIEPSCSLILRDRYIDAEIVIISRNRPDMLID